MIRFSMGRARRMAAVLGAAAALSGPGGYAAEPSAPTVDSRGDARASVAAGAADVVDLGGGHYRVGAIEIDKNSGRFTVPGNVLAVDTAAMPIEFLAVTRGAIKAYEATIELDASAVAFNVACIVLGLDATHATLPKYHFDPTVLRGDPVDLEVRWVEGGQPRQYPLGELLLNRNGPVTHDWVYVGSSFTPDGSYLAEYFGTLIGVVHDPDSILQHRSGLGLGDYGAVTVNPDRMPPAGTSVTLVVTRPSAPPVSENLTDR